MLAKLQLAGDEMAQLYRRTVVLASAVKSGRQPHHAHVHFDTDSGDGGEMMVERVGALRRKRHATSPQSNHDDVVAHALTPGGGMFSPESLATPALSWLSPSGHTDRSHSPGAIERAHAAAAEAIGAEDSHEHEHHSDEHAEAEGHEHDHGAGSDGDDPYQAGGHDYPQANDQDHATPPHSLHGRHGAGRRRGGRKHRHRPAHPNGVAEAALDVLIQMDEERLDMLDAIDSSGRVLLAAAAHFSTANGKLLTSRGQQSPLSPMVVGGESKAGDARDGGGSSADGDSAAIVAAVREAASALQDRNEAESERMPAGCSHASGGSAEVLRFVLELLNRLQCIKRDVAGAVPQPTTLASILASQATVFGLSKQAAHALRDALVERVQLRSRADAAQPVAEPPDDYRVQAAGQSLYAMAGMLAAPQPAPETSTSTALTSASSSVAASSEHSEVREASELRTRGNETTTRFVPDTRSKELQQGDAGGDASDKPRATVADGRSSTTEAETHAVSNRGFREAAAGGGVPLMDALQVQRLPAAIAKHVTTQMRPATVTSGALRGSGTAAGGSQLSTLAGLQPTRPPTQQVSRSGAGHREGAHLGQPNFYGLKSSRLRPLLHAPMAYGPMPDVVRPANRG